MLQGGDHSRNTEFKTLVEESQFEVEPFDNGVRGRLSIVALGFLVGDK
jgi:hypothetical protein